VDSLEIETTYVAYRDFLIRRRLIRDDDWYRMLRDRPVPTRS